MAESTGSLNPELSGSYTDPIWIFQDPQIIPKWWSVKTGGVWVSSSRLGRPRDTNWAIPPGKGLNAIVVHAIGSNPGFHACSLLNQSLITSGTSPPMALQTTFSLVFKARPTRSQRSVCRIPMILVQELVNHVFAAAPGTPAERSLNQMPHIRRLVGAIIQFLCAPLIWL